MAVHSHPRRLMPEQEHSSNQQQAQLDAEIAPEAPVAQQQLHNTSTISGPTHHSNNNLAFAHNAAPFNISSNGIEPGDGDDADSRPAKRRKVTGGRDKETQSTLDHHFAPSTDKSSIRPPSKLSVVEPHGQLLETLNGVQTALDVGEDALLTPASTVVPQGSRRASRSSAPPNPAQKKQEDKRTLRSQDDGPRLKSELATYFPNYEDIMFDAPMEEEFWTLETALYVVDEQPAQGGAAHTPGKTSKSAKASSAHARRTSVNGALSPTPLQRTASSQFNGSPSLNLDLKANNIPSNPGDPLSDAHFFKSHRRAERKEKQLRNIERERAMHEKVQLDRLLDGLQGHDWLRVLGITGITDGEAKKYEPKRDYFISEVRALVDKFRQWKDQEKKQRLEKEAALAAEEESVEGSVEPPSSDVNASAARQLQRETAGATKVASRLLGKGKERAATKASTTRPATIRLLLPPRPPSPEVPITSFYAKRHLRDAALGKARSGRNVTAFGQPLPEMEEREFVVPKEYVTEDALRANARERRRRKRESVVDAAEASAQGL